MKKILLALLAILAAGVPPVRGQAQISSTAKPMLAESRNRTFFPKNWVRGFVDFGIAPSHNEPDLGRCSFPQAPNSGGTRTLCTAYARYMLIGYMEFQPLARTPARHLFLFFEPKLSFGRNIPQLHYSASMEPIAYDRSMGIGFQLPKNFELRVTQHQVNYLGRYRRYVGPSDLGKNGPYGLYTTINVRWSFGGYGRAGAPPAY
ncbi:MAG: hypothetical protein LAN84_01695 [Acidobacteriia bacterium]|nr:hypothetical protein [Terriglobia bacterium]